VQRRMSALTSLAASTDGADCRRPSTRCARVGCSCPASVHAELLMAAEVERAACEIVRAGRRAVRMPS
jgi:hypothetical protein